MSGLPDAAILDVNLAGDLVYHLEVHGDLELATGARLILVRRTVTDWNISLIPLNCAAYHCARAILRCFTKAEPVPKLRSQGKSKLLLNFWNAGEILERNHRDGTDVRRQSPAGKAVGDAPGEQ